ncbi:MAG: ATP-binding protein [Bacteroidales bacterium]|nr:ATP-binding protein [Bacteroidales bacterium]
MEQVLVGRKHNLKLLKEYIDSERSEFVAVYGRRRVGKTFLIRYAAGDNFSFYVTGVHGATKDVQLTNFAIALQKYSGSENLNIRKNWILAFYELSKYLESLPQGKKIIFIDELPWMDTAKSGFISSLENFWNSWAALRDDVKLFVCGSATSWMINNLIKNRGGLHNRLTHHLTLQPFTLNECDEYFKTYGFAYSQKQVADCYMAMGGVPYYMTLMDRSKSVAQNIDSLFFSKDAPLKDEFNDLYKALFKNASPHINIVTALAAKGIGLTRKELIQETDLTDNGAFSTVLEELEQCGFIRVYQPFENSSQPCNKRVKSNALYQLVDFYTLFYFKFIKNNRYGDEHFWLNSLNSPMFNTWCGLSFELLCMMHITQLKDALGISGVQTRVCSWRSKGSGSGVDSREGAQIDLLIDRKDETVNICEIKYYKEQFEISKDYEERLQNKLNRFAKETKTNKSLLLTMITANGIKHNSHSDIVQKEIVLEDLFK